MVRILVADDEQDLAWALRHSLTDEGYEVICAYDGLEALKLARSDRPDVIILDIAMPVLDGLEVCRRLRRDPALAAVPILFLTVRRDPEDRVRGLNHGSDDYLVKPFDLRELKARIRALLRRSQRHTARLPSSEDTELVVGSLTLDLNRKLGKLGERSVRLTPTEFALLRYLMLHPGQLFSSQELLRAVWRYDPAATAPSLVRWHIRNLRFKIEPDPSQPTYLRTASRHGYFLASDE